MNALPATSPSVFVRPAFWVLPFAETGAEPNGANVKRRGSPQFAVRNDEPGTVSPKNSREVGFSFRFSTRGGRSDGGVDTTGQNRRGP